MTKLKQLAWLGPVAALVLHFTAVPAAAQAWPTKPVRFVVAGAPGSAPDVIARLIGSKLTNAWVQQVVIDNKPGAAGNLGTEAAARATPDGYTLLFGQAAPLSMNRHVFKAMSFEPDKDFVPVVNIGLSPMMIAVNPNLPAKTIAELVALAKAQPGKLSFGTSSQRNIPHLTGELLKRMGGFEMTHVAYSSNNQALADVMKGDTQMMVDGLPVLINHVKEGRLRALAVSSTRRLPGLEDIPTVAETLPGFASNGWFAILAPTGTPQAVITRVNMDVNAVLKMEDVAGRIRGFGVYPEGGTPEALTAFIREDSARWGETIRAAGIQPE